MLSAIITPPFIYAIAAAALPFYLDITPPLLAAASLLP
jgi:hypothetical protein